MEMEINSYINSYVNNSEKTELTDSICHIDKFSNQEYRFTMPKSRTRLAVKQEEEEEHRQLKSVMRFTIAQKS